MICELCFRHCNLSKGQTGFCRARACRNGVIVPLNYGKLTSLVLDPIEKKPLRRFYPGSLILSTGSFGCNLRCPFCQNHEISMCGETEIETVDLSPDWIFGPALLIQVPNFSKSGYAERYPVSRSRRKDFCTYLEALPVYGADEFLSMAICLHEQINGTALSKKDVQIVDRNKPKKRAQQFAAAEFYEQTDLEDYSQMQEIQVEICNYIRSGNPEMLTRLFSQKKMSYHLGLISDVVENYKATAAMAITLAMQAAVDGGLDYAIAMHTFDFFMLSMKHQTDVREVLNLTAAAQREFALKVEQLKLPQSYPPVLVKVIHYIRSHLYEPLTAAEIAERTHTSQSYISKLFVKHTGMATGEYIRSQKIEEAKQLLQRTEISISDIAYRLAFSSQPQFQKVFKHYTGTTPKQYRSASVSDAK